jgi:hypothetical protein
MKTLLMLVSLCILHAEEGMWTFNNFPADKVKAQYGFTPTKEWLDHVRLSSVRLAEGCSASLISPNGMVLTNHHCAATCIQQNSTAEKNYTANGFQPKSAAEEVRCPGQEANILESITDVTDKVAAATKGLADKAANAARKAEFAKIEKECATSDELRCEVISLYGGGVYDLYKYRRYQDVRLVFAPEFAIAFFGGDPDNFNFPRYDLDMSVLRIYENGKPLQTKDYFPISKEGAKDGALTFVSGNPGSTQRLFTTAQLEDLRDFVLRHKLLYLSEYRGLLTMFQTRGAEQARVSNDELFLVENSLKAYKGEQESLLEPAFFGQKKKEENEFRAKVNADPKMKAEYGKVWDQVAKTVKDSDRRYLSMIYFEGMYGFRSDLFQLAKTVLRSQEEFAKPNEKRLPEYADARKPEVELELGSTAPIDPELEIEKLTFSLTKLREVFGMDDQRVRQIFGKRSPREIATEAVKGTKLGDPKARKSAGASDTMIALAKLVDPIARAARKEYEDDVEAPIKRGQEQLAKARFAVYGKSIYPDATFTLRLSYGAIKGWMENGKPVDPFTNFNGAYEHATGRDPYKLPDSWIKAKDKLNPLTPFDFVTTNDIIGGNSGSPVIDKDGRIVGLVFDGNIHSLGGAFGFDSALNRTVAVHSRAILEALEKVYGAQRVLSEIKVQ